MSEVAFKNKLSKYFPEPAIHYCYTLWRDHAFTLKVKKKRASKLGDYRFDPNKKVHTISVNNDLNPYSFLITYVHEVAHLVTFKEHKRSVKPHGTEWKNNFKKLMIPVLNSEVFPDRVLRTLANYLKNPKASSCNDHHLMKALQSFDTNKHAISLSEISTGELFKFRHRIFRKETLRRTRYVCCEVSTKRKYLISRVAEVERV
ncbi:hypothetical protein C900_01162 [Fulvivirga imtechensis AK7]|uniref:SprT-like domain-containing protein n=1 Tax=Fulvivirga imtechensis AK7 TaxID=1237149 RepID=L8JIJ3_9BACT|nr:SprT-like domain-containing protein [Fulvivirga imtechensis]ELR68083.1 hypothetical protein C900_01162 [Fulvivirga imtechensis AK7]